MKDIYRKRRLIGLLILLVTSIVTLVSSPSLYEPIVALLPSHEPKTIEAPTGSALEVLQTLEVKGRAPKTGYKRTQFGSGWTTRDGCDTRNIILVRDLEDEFVDSDCKVQRGTLHDPYTGETYLFVRGETTSQDIQIDHVVALSNAWQTGAQQLSPKRREALANDPLELLAVAGSVNQQKSDGDAASWLPPNKLFRCQYVARQIAVKQKYDLWLTPPEKNAMLRVLSVCPSQGLPARDSRT